MFLHIFKYRVISLLREKNLVFWTMIFPLVLATFFSVALSNIGKVEEFSPIGVALVNGEALNQHLEFKQTMEELSKGDHPLFELTIGDDAAALKSLKDYEISGYIIPGQTPELVVLNSGLNQSILKHFLNQYSQNTAAIKEIVASNPEALPDLLESLSMTANYVVEKGVTEKSTDPTLVYFYALIAMACLYGSMYGLEEVNRVQANLSSKAARINIAPVHKLKVFAAGVLAALILHFSGLLILLAYMDKVLGVSFGQNTGYVIMVLFVGSILGISMGTFISALVKKGEGVKIAVVLIVSMAGSFLAGMMIGEVKYYVAKHVPILGYLNPANLLSDSLYALYYYDSHMRFFLNLTGMSLYSIVFCGMTYLIIRGRKYASL
ncbi:ABC transporter permease [Fusibacter bizertensis]